MTHSLDESRLSERKPTHFEVKLPRFEEELWRFSFAQRRNELADGLTLLLRGLGDGAAHADEIDSVVLEFVVVRVVVAMGLFDLVSRRRAVANRPSGPALQRPKHLDPVHVFHEGLRKRDRPVRVLMVLEERDQDARARDRRVVQGVRVRE